MRLGFRNFALAAVIAAVGDAQVKMTFFEGKLVYQP